MSDSLGVNYTVSGLSFLCKALKKGQLQDWIFLDNDLCQKYGDPFDGGRLCFRVRKASSLLDEWTVDDYRDLIDFGNYFKLEQFKSVNKLFLDNSLVLKTEVIIPNESMNIVLDEYYVYSAEFPDGKNKKEAEHIFNISKKHINE